MLTTLVLFFVFQPEESGTLFYFNLCYTLWLEVLFFGWLGLLRTGTREVSTVFRIVVGISAGYYVMAGTCIMLLYSLLLSSTVGIRWYIATLVILTLVWLLLASLLAQTDANHHEKMEQLAEDTHSLHFFTSKVERLCRQCERAYATRGLKYQTTANLQCPVEKLKNKIAYLTPNVLQRGNAVAQLNTILEQCAERIDALENAPDEQLKEAERKLIRYIDTSIEDIDFIKNSTRR